MMSFIYIFISTILIVNACHPPDNTFAGTYELEVSGLKIASSGFIEIVGEKDDCFGQITFLGTRERTFEIGLKEIDSDTLRFRLPGGEGYLNLFHNDSIVAGRFKYFGLNAQIYGKKTGPPSNDLLALLEFKPIGLGTISRQSEESFPAYDSTNDILYFCRDNNLYSSQRSTEGWQQPYQLSFSHSNNDSAPYIYNKGKSLLFTSNRIEGDGAPGKKNIWKSEKIGQSWSQPVKLPSPINLENVGDYHSAITSAGSIYFISYDREGGYGRSDVYVAQKTPDSSFQISNLGPSINSELSEADVYVAPDDSYILFASTGRDDGYGADDIYISYKENGTWSQPINLGPKVNSFAYEYGAWVDHENAMMYFNSYRRGSSDIYSINLNQLDVLRK